MAPAPQLNYRSILTDIKNRRFAPAYILSGEEPYFLDVISNALQESVVEEEGRDFNQHIYFGLGTDIDAVINTAQQYPMMSEYKLVMIREAQSMEQAKSKLDRLEKYFKHPCGTTILVIVFKGEALRATTGWIKAAQKANAIVFTSPKIRDYQLDKYVKEYCTEKRINIEPKASAMLCDYIGPNLSRLYSEIEKIKVGNSDTEGKTFAITAEMVERYIGVSKEFNNFELTTALMNRDYAKSMRIVDYFGKSKTNPLVVTCGTIFASFAKLMQAHYLPDKSAEGMMKALQLNNSFALQDIKTGMRNYTAGSCLRIIRAIREFDINTKGVNSTQKDVELIKELIYKIFTL